MTIPISNRPSQPAASSHSACLLFGVVGLVMICAGPAVAGAAEHPTKKGDKAAKQRSARPRYYVRVREVKLQTPKPCGSAPELARKLLGARLREAPTIVTKLANDPLQGDALAKALAAQGLEGYAIDLRIVSCTHALGPPRSGSPYRLLSVEVSAALDAEKIPSGQIARAGDGTTRVGTEVRRIKPRELDQLRSEALEAAIGQALGKFIDSLKQRSPRRKRKRSRRSAPRGRRSQSP